MRLKNYHYLSFLMILFCQFLFAQEKTISGVVSDELGPLPGANVLIKGTTNGVQADFDGKYSIKVKQGETLVFSFIGMVEQQKVVGASTVINVKLTASSVNLSEVVVEGYRNSTRPKSNVAIATVSAANIESRPNASFIQTLQSQVAGLNIQTGSGQPGSGSTVIIRGAGSINGNIEPLYLIDGVPQNGDNFRSINPNEIQSVSVLKDGGATAIYGNRGSNGVIVVTTKKGSYDSEISFDYFSTTGFTELQGNDYNLMNSRQILALEKSRGVGRGNTLTDSQIAAYPINTNWNKEFFRTGVTQSHTLNISSGGKNLASFTSFGFTDQDGILLNTDLKRFNFRNNLNGKSSNGKFKYSTSLTLNWSKRNQATSIGTGGVNQNFVLGANNSVPYISPSEYTGSVALDQLYASDGTLVLTPLFLLDKINTFENTIDETKAIASINGSYQLTKDIEFTSSLGLDYTQSNVITFQDPVSFNSLVFQEDDEEFVGFESRSTARTMLINYNNKLTYSKTFKDKHNVEVSLFTEYFKGHADSFGYTQNGLDPKVSLPGAGVGYIIDNVDNDYYVPTVTSSKSIAGLFSYFGFVDYDYNSKYGFSASVRRDASYRFNTSNRWGTFWSLSGRWNIDKETFMQNTAFDALKLRASIGTNGNQDILGTGFFGAENSSRTLYDAVTGYANQNSYGIVQLGNDDLKWETVRQANVGIDFSLNNSRFNGSVDVYEKKTIDLYQSVDISAINAITTINANSGSLRNRGVELNLSYDLFRNVEQDFKFTLKFNGSYNKNEILDLPQANRLNWDGESLTANAEGNLLSEFYLIKYAGVNPQNGNMLFYGADGLLTENPDPATDRRFTGKSALPVYQGGFGFDLDYKGFFVSSLFSFVKDIWRFDYDYSGLVNPTNIGVFNLSTDIQNAWTPTNRNTYMPSLDASNFAIDDFSDRFLKDASYLRLRFLSIGYNFKKKVLEKTFLKGVRVFAQGENLVTWSKWRGWDAESNRAADQYQYPTPRIYTLGLEIKF
jgi:TonB-linked SusC/RagA family outer membrane protein